MALDSKAKRAAVPGVGRPFMRSQFPVGAKNRAWRASVANTYPVKDFSAEVDVLSFGKRAATPIRGLVAVTPIRGLDASEFD